jgi:hypothetical protein
LDILHLSSHLIPHNVPIIYFDNRKHINHNFLRIIRTIRISNPVFLISGATKLPSDFPKNKVNFVGLHEIRGYEKISEQFLSNYVHLSTHSYEFETACFLRYFAHQCFMDKLKIDKAFLFDTDVWPAKSLSNYNSAKLSIFSPNHTPSKTISAHSSFLNYSDLYDFNNYLLNEFYQNNIEELKKLFNHMKELNSAGGVSDMLALGMFLQESNNTIKWNDSNKFSFGNSFLNHTFSTLYLDFNISKESWFLIVRKRDYFIVRSKRITRFYSTMHFQGNDKYLILWLEKFFLLYGNRWVFHFLIRISRKFLNSYNKN